MTWRNTLRTATCTGRDFRCPVRTEPARTVTPRRYVTASTAYPSVRGWREGQPPKQRRDPTKVALDLHVREEGAVDHPRQCDVPRRDAPTESSPLRLNRCLHVHRGSELQPSLI